MSQSSPANSMAYFSSLSKHSPCLPYPWHGDPVRMFLHTNPEKTCTSSRHGKSAAAQTSLGSGKNIWQVRPLHIFSPAAKAGHQTSQGLTHKQAYRHLLQSFSRSAQMRQSRKATNPIAIAAVNTSAFDKSWVRNTPPALTEKALLACWPPQKPTLKWSSVHCTLSGLHGETLSWKR